MELQKILSLDQALDKTGFSILLISDLDVKIERCGVLNLTDISRMKDLTIEQKLEERITNVKEFLKRVINTYKIDIVVVEDIQAQKNLQTYKNLASLQGNLKNYMYSNEIPFCVLKPSEWRSTLGIKGRTRQVQKENAQKYIKTKFGLETTEDEADSICLGIAASRRLKNKRLNLIKEI